MASHLIRRRKRNVRSAVEENAGIGNVSARVKIRSPGPRAGWTLLISLMRLAFTAQDVSSLHRYCDHANSSVFHHDGPFDACNPHRNRAGSKRAPMQAFPKD